LFWSGAFLRLELAALDKQFQWLSGVPIESASDDVGVVGLDEASLQEFAVPVAILHRQIGVFFESMVTAKARAVAIDVVLPGFSYDNFQPGLDASVARGILSLRPFAPLVLGQTATADGRLRPIHPLFVNLVGPQGLGTVLVLKDQDGRVRHFDERIGVEGQAVPSLPGQLARSLQLPPRYGVVPLFRGKPAQFIPLRDVLAWKADGNIVQLQSVFAGKVVLLGSMLDFDDMHEVSVSLATNDLGGTTHGVFILARQIQALLHDTLIREIPSYAEFIVALLCTLTWWIRPRKWLWSLAAMAMAGLAVLSMWLLVVGWVIPLVTLELALLTGLLGRLGVVSWQTAAERRRLRLAFDGLVSPGVLEEILSGRLHPQLAGERRQICVLFSDIRSFTTLSEHLAPEVVTELLNRYFERMVSCVHRHGGTLDKFIGDGIMAFFGAPRPILAPCADAFNASADMLVELEAFNQEQRERGGPQLAIGIGLHYGPAFLGYVGSKDRNEYSAIGDTVNTSARLEGLTKDSGYPLIVSDTVRALLPDVPGFIELGKQAVKGRAAIEIFGWRPLNGRFNNEAKNEPSST
jgi:adenylate cyclase